MTAILWPKTEGLPPPDFEERLCACLRGRVERAYLFGSFGTDAFRAGSDIDLILVCDTGFPFVERARQFMDVYDLYPRMDLLVYTAEELETQLSETSDSGPQSKRICVNCRSLESRENESNHPYRR